MMTDVLSSGVRGMRDLEDLVRNNSYEGRATRVFSGDTYLDCYYDNGYFGTVESGRISCDSMKQKTFYAFLEMCGKGIFTLPVDL